MNKRTILFIITIFYFIILLEIICHKSNTNQINELTFFILQLIKIWWRRSWRFIVM